jgi:carbon-monoxide dehydrogenase medium subunit
MLPASFDYVAPTSILAAVEALSASPDARFAAGSVHLLIDLKMRRVSLSKLVDLRKIPELYGISAGNDGLHIGAMTSLRALMDDKIVQTHFRALAEAAELSGDAQMRNMEAIGGTLAYAAPTSDIAAAVLALNATIHATGLRGARSIPAGAFFTGDRTTALAHDEIITSVSLPRPFSASAYTHFRHPAHLGAVCGVAAAVALGKDGKVERARIGVTGATSHAFRLTAVEDALVGSALDADSIAAAAALVSDDRAYLSDLQFSGEYRAHLVTVLTKRALSQLA